MKAIHTIDSHTGGEGTRLVINGLPPLRGATMAEKMAETSQSLGWLPGLLLREPRGHKDLYGALLTPACHPLADQGILFMNNRGYEPMCGHALIGVITSLLESGLFPASGPEVCLVIDTAAGLVPTWTKMQDGRVLAVSFENVPSFAVSLDAALHLPGGTQLTVDVAFGGNYFVLVQARQVGIELLPANAGRLADLGMRVLAAANQQFEVRHPEIANIDRITDVRFIDKLKGTDSGSRNIVVLGEAMIDRSPCGTGTCAELAVRYARRQLRLGETFTSQGLLGTHFTAQVVREIQFPGNPPPYPVIIPRIEGRAFLTGYHRFILQDDDPFPQGFALTQSG
ncbi:MAG: proline racemase family protein [Chloroflexota bacterium]